MKGKTLKQITNTPKVGLRKLSSLPSNENFNIELISDESNKKYTIDVTELSNSTSGIESIVAGDNITIDDTDPLNPIVSVQDITLSGEVTGSTSLSAIDKTAITNKTTETIVGTDYVLFGDTSDGDNLKKGLVSDIVALSGGGGGGSPAGSDTQIQYNNAGAFGADAGFTRDGATGNTNISATYGIDTYSYKLDDNLFGDGTVGLLQQYSSTDGSSGYAGIIKEGTDLGFLVNIDTGAGNSFEIFGYPGEAGFIVNDGSGFTLRDEQYSLALSHTTQSAVTFTGSGLDDLTLGGIFSGTASTTYTVTVAGTGTPDTFDWTDGTNSGTGVSMSTSPTLLSNGISITFGADTGHTLSDSWTWTYSIVNQNVLDFSNNDYKFQSTFGTDTFGYQISDNLLGYGIKGAVNTWANGSDFSLSGTYLQGTTLTSGTTIQIGSASAASLLEIDKSYASISDGTDSGNYNLRVNQLGLSNTIGGIDYGIEQSAGVVTIGNTNGGNNTKITIDDLNEHITISNLSAYDDDTAAGVGGLTAGMVYMTTGSGSAPLNAAGILMIKQ